MSKSRLLSLLVAGIYILIAYISRETVPKYMWYLLAPMGWGLACIWFGDELGGMLGYFHDIQITSTTPGSIIRFVGWLLLILLPIIACMLQKSVDKSG